MFPAILSAPAVLPARVGGYATTPPGWREGLALALVVLAAAIWLALLRRLGVRRELLAWGHRPVLRWWPAVLAAAPLALFVAPTVRFELLHRLGARVSVAAESHRLVPTSTARPPMTFQVCEVTVRLPAGGSSRARLHEAACGALDRDPTLLVPVVVVGDGLLVQPGLEADPRLAWLGLEGLILAVMAGILWASHRLPLPPVPRAPRPTSLLRGGAWAGEGRPVSPRIMRAVQRALRGRELRYDARLPDDEQLVEVELYGDPRPGEPQTWILLPVGADGAGDPDRARRFWVRTGLRGSEEDPRSWAGSVAGPFGL